MNLQVYSKEYEDLESTTKKQKRRQKIDRGFSALLLFLGVAAIGLALWPAFLWQISTSQTLGAKIRNPVPQKEVIAQNPIFGDIQVVKDPDGFTYFTTSKVKSYDSAYLGPRPSEFYLTIPKLKIDKAKVSVDSLNFTKNLALFPQTAIPGEVGNAFVTGHSTLPILYDPKDYKSIFTKLPTLEVGDEIFVDVSDQNLKFVVEYTKSVDPQDTSVLAPISPKGRNLTLMTCIPPGISTKRLVVVTSLI